MRNVLEKVRRRRLERFAASRRALAAARESLLARWTAARRYRYVRWKLRAFCQVVDFVGFAWLRLVRAVGGSCNPDPHAEPRCILIVQLDHLGDAILSTGLLRGLRQRYPAATIDVLAGEWNRELFESCSEVDRVHVSAVNRFARGRGLRWIIALLWWGWRLRGRYDLAIDVRGEFPLAVLLWLTGARRRIGWNCGGGGFLLTDTADYEINRSETASRQVLLDVLGIGPPPSEAAWPPRVTPNAAARHWAEEQFSCAVDRPLIVCHVGAGTSAKHWPVEHWRELIRRLPADHDARLVLIGSERDRIGAGDNTAQGAMLALVVGMQSSAIAKEHSDIDDRTGQLTLSQLAAVLERADLFVGADSGPAHLAAAVGTPVVVLFSGTNDPRQWQPWGPRVEVVRQPVACSPCHRESCPLADDHPCMRGLSPDAVLAAVKQALEAKAATRFESTARQEVCA